MREKSEEAAALMQPDDAWKMLRLPRLVQVVRKRCILTDHLHRLFQHVGGEYGGSGEGMAFRHDGKGFEAGDDFSGKLFPSQKGEKRPFAALRKADDGQRGAAKADVPDSVHGAALPVVYGQCPPLCMPGQKGRKGCVDIACLRHADLQREASLFLSGAEMLQRLILPHGLFGKLQKFPSPVRRDHPAGAACEDGKADFLLQLTDIPAQIRLTDEKLLCRSCDGAAFFYFYGITKHIQVHFSSFLRPNGRSLLL